MIFSGLKYALALFIALLLISQHEHGVDARGNPTFSPTPSPTFYPTSIPSGIPTIVPSSVPSIVPSAAPSGQPTSIPTNPPTPFSDASLSFDKIVLNEALMINIEVFLSQVLDASYEILIRLPRFYRTYKNIDISEAETSLLEVFPSNTFYVEWIDGDYDVDIPYDNAYIIVRFFPHVETFAESTLSLTIMSANNIAVYCGSPSSTDYFNTSMNLEGSTSVPSILYRNMYNTGTDGLTYNSSLPSEWTEYTFPKPFSLFPQIGSGCANRNNCSNHGVCNYCSGSCVCDEGYGSRLDIVTKGRDLSSSCNTRICPSGIAVADVAQSPTLAHQVAECSNQGKCNRATGNCSCFAPFSGPACNELTCPSSVDGVECSGHGVCWNMAEIAADDEFGVTSYGSTALAQATVAWDYRVMKGCVCNSTSWDVGYGYGQYQLAEYYQPDCSLRRCPSGDNPFTCENEEDCYGKNQLNGVIKGEMGNKCHIECSGRGSCNRTSGVCSCFNGSTGVACNQIDTDAGYEIPDCIPTSVPTSAPSVTFNPTSEPTNVPSSQPTSNPTGILYLPSNITSCRYLENSATKNGAMVNCSMWVDTFDHQAVVYCAGYETAAEFNAPRHAEDVILQQNSALSSGGVAIVTLTNLIPSTTYDIYCASVSMAGISSPIIQVLNSRMRDIRTGCCRAAAVSVSTIPLIEGNFRFSGASITVPALPLTILNASMQAYDYTTGELSQNITFNPPYRLYNYHSLSLTVDFDVIAGAAAEGKYWINATLGGTAASDYAITYVYSHVLTVVNDTAVPMVPSLVRAVFANDGGSIVATFDSETNQAGLSGDFNCDLLFIFFGNTMTGYATCKWIDTVNVAIFVNDGLIVNSNITLRSNTVYAKCTANPVVPCAYWTAASGSVLMQTALDPIKPTVILSGAEIVSVCGNTTLDMSASIGSAGRDWFTKPKFTLMTTTAASTDRLMNFLNNIYKYSPPTPISGDLIEAGAKYTLNVELCNFLYACGETTFYFEVSDRTDIPYSNILGTPDRFIRSWETLTVNGDGFVNGCDGGVSTADLEYIWYILELGEIEMDVKSLSTADKSKFILPPYTLQPNKWYSLKFRTRHKITLNFNDDFVIINVVSGVLIPVISGGSEISIREGTNQLLDGSLSVDEDAANLDFLTKEWSCLQVYPYYSTICPLSTSVRSGGEKLMVYAPSGNATTCRISFTISDDNRTATTSVYVATVVSATALLTMDHVNDPILNSRPLILSSLVDVGGVFNCTWGVNDSSIDLNKLSVAPITKQYKAVEKRIYDKAYLSLPVHSLRGGTTYSFSFTCGTVAASIVLRVNLPPQYGTLLVTPYNGIALSTIYTFSTQRWYDVDYPIGYQFGFVSTRGIDLVTKSRSEESYSQALLPASNSSVAYAVHCFVDAIDVFGASNQKRYTVVVLPAPVVPSNEDMLIVLNKGKGGIDDTKNRIAIVSSVVSQVDCSNSPDCSLLNREVCSANTLTNTCGECLPGYVGDNSLNSICVINTTETVNPVYVYNGTSQEYEILCSVDSDCGWWGICGNNGCYVPSKSCVNDCSGHGVCSFINKRTGNRLPECFADNPRCKGKCLCDEGYTGTDCRYVSNSTELLDAKRVTDNLAISLYSISKIEYPTAEVVSNWVALVPSIIANVDYMTTQSVAAMFSVVTASVKAATTFKMPLSEIDSVLTSADTLISLVSSKELASITTIDNSSRRLIDVQSSEFADLADFTLESARELTVVMLDSYMDLVSASLVPGQDQIESFYETFKLLSAVFPTNTSAYNVTLALPQSIYENQANVLPASVSFEVPATDFVDIVVVNGTEVLEEVTYGIESNETDSLSGVAGNATISIVENSVVQYGGNQSGITSNVIRIFAKNVNFDAGYTILFQNNDPVSYPHVQSNLTYSTRCFEDIESFHTYYCYDGFNITHYCNGTQGLHVTDCPSQIYQPKCYPVLGINISEDFDRCELISYTNYNTTCQCNLGVGHPDNNPNISKVYNESYVVELGTVKIYLPSEYYNVFTPSVSPDSYIIISLSAVIWFVLVMLGSYEAGVYYKIIDPFDMKKIIKREFVEAPKVVKLEPVRTPGYEETVFEFINELLPPVFQRSDKDWKEVVVEELFLNHRYVNMFKWIVNENFDFFKGLKAYCQAMSTCTALLFFITVFLTVQVPVSDGSCATHEDIDSCLERKSVFDDKISYCRWQSRSEYSGTEHCYYRESRLDWRPCLLILLMVGVCMSMWHVLIDFLLDVAFSEAAGEGSNFHNIENSDCLSNAGAVAPHSLSPKKASPAVTTKPSKVRQTLIFATLRNSQESPLRDHRMIPEQAKSGKMRDVLASTKSSRSLTEAGNLRSKTQETRELYDEKLLDQMAVWGSPPFYEPMAKEETKMVLSPASPKHVPFYSVRNISKLSASLSAGLIGGYNIKERKSDGTEYDKLLYDMSLQLTVSMTKKEKKLFLSEWMIEEGEEEGASPCSFLSPYVAKAVQSDANNTVRLAESLYSWLQKLFVSEAQVGATLLHTFIVDLMGRNTVEARVVAATTANLMAAANPRFKRLLAGGSLACINIGLFVGVVVLGGFRSLKWQVSFLVTFILQCILELFIVELLSCVYLYYIVPMFAHHDLRAALDILQQTMKKMHDIEIGIVSNDSKRFDLLDYPAYLFVSRTVAQKYSDMFESTIVQFYTSVLPGAFSAKWRREFNPNKKGLNWIAFNFKYCLRYMNVRYWAMYIGGFPIALQTMVVHALMNMIITSVFIIPFMASINRWVLIIALPLFFGLIFVSFGGISTVLLTPAKNSFMYVASLFSIFWKKYPVFPVQEEFESEFVHSESGDETNEDSEEELQFSLILGLDDVITEQAVEDEDKQNELEQLSSGRARRSSTLRKGSVDGMSLQSFSTQDGGSRRGSLAGSRRGSTRLPSIKIRRKSVVNADSRRRSSVAGRRRSSVAHVENAEQATVVEYDLARAAAGNDEDADLIDLSSSDDWTSDDEHLEHPAQGEAASKMANFFDEIGSSDDGGESLSSASLHFSSESSAENLDPVVRLPPPLPAWKGLGAVSKAMNSFKKPMENKSPVKPRNIQREKEALKEEEHFENVIGMFSAESMTDSNSNPFKAKKLNKHEERNELLYELYGDAFVAEEHPAELTIGQENHAETRALESMLELFGDALEDEPKPVDSSVFRSPRVPPEALPIRYGSVKISETDLKADAAEQNALESMVGLFEDDSISEQHPVSNKELAPVVVPRLNIRNETSNLLENESNSGVDVLSDLGSPGILPPVRTVRGRKPVIDADAAHELDVKIGGELKPLKSFVSPKALPPLKQKPSELSSPVMSKPLSDGNNGLFSSPKVVEAEEMHILDEEMHSPGEKHALSTIVGLFDDEGIDEKDGVKPVHVETKEPLVLTHNSNGTGIVDEQSKVTKKSVELEDGGSPKFTSPKVVKTVSNRPVELQESLVELSDDEEDLGVEHDEISRNILLDDASSVSLTENPNVRVIRSVRNVPRTIEGMHSGTLELTGMALDSTSVLSLNIPDDENLMDKSFSLSDDDASQHSGEIAAVEGMVNLFGDCSDDDINIDSDSDVTGENNELPF